MTEVRITEYGGPSGQKRIRFDGLTDREHDQMQGAAMGNCWIRVRDGRLESSPSFKPLPAPIDDPAVMPHWTNDPTTGPAHAEDWLDATEGWHDPSLIVQYLGAGGRSSYDRSASLLESYGFECLRSRRGVDGRFWELWFLPSLSLAHGELKTAIAGCKTDWRQKPCVLLQAGNALPCERFVGGSKLMNVIPALSLTEPWASLMVHGHKAIETRSWSTKYRGWLWIHASKGFPKNCRELCYEEPFVDVLPDPFTPHLGCIIGAVYLADCMQMTETNMPGWTEMEWEFGDYSPGRWMWKTRAGDHARLDRPVPAKGSLGLWMPTGDVLAALRLSNLQRLFHVDTAGQGELGFNR